MNNKGERNTNTDFMLTGLLNTSDDIAFTNITANKNGKLYRYYRNHGKYLNAGSVELITYNLLDDLKYQRELQKLFYKIIYDDKTLRYVMFKNQLDVEVLRGKDKYKVYPSLDQQYIIVEISTNLVMSATTIQYGGNSKAIITKQEANVSLVKALSYAWRYKKMYESGMMVDEILEHEKMGRRKLYYYLNMAYLSPKIHNSILSNDIPKHIHLKSLSDLASKYVDFAEQEQAYYNDLSVT